MGTAANHRVELKRGLQFLEMRPVAREWRARVGQAQGQALQNRQAVVPMSRPWRAVRPRCGLANMHMVGGWPFRSLSI